MTAARSIAPIRHTVTVDAPVADAWSAFTAGINAWWPRDASWSGGLLQRMVMDPGPGGFIHEIGAHGMRLDWARISAWEPPHRLSFSWQISPDRTPTPSPSQASQVEVRFEPIATGRTRVRLLHEGWERHGDAGAAYRDQLAAAAFWPQLLERFAGVVARREEAPWTGLTT